MASTATPTVLKAPKAMQAACVALPEGCLVPYGKDGYRVTAPLPVGSIIFGHGACVVRSTGDYDKVQACRGTKRATESDAEEGAEDKEEAKRRKKAARLVRHLPDVVQYMGEDDQAKLQRLAARLTDSAANLAARLTAVAAPKPAAGADSDDPIVIEEDEQAEVDRAAGVQQQRLERAQTGHWDHLLGGAPSDSDEEAAQEAVAAANTAALKQQVFAALGDDESDSEAPAGRLFPKTGRQVELVAALEESRRGTQESDEEAESGSDEE